jgi:hypothetical protein
VYWKYPALQPEMPFIDGKAPKKVKRLKPVWIDNDYVLFWRAPKAKDWKDEAVKYVVYRFAKGEKVNVDDPSKIYTITSNNFVKLPYKDGGQKWVFAVTALDRLQNESRVVKKSVKL